VAILMIRFCEIKVNSMPLHHKRVVITVSLRSEFIELGRTCKVLFGNSEKLILLVVVVVVVV
jgi:hypothetical protein